MLQSNDDGKFQKDILLVCLFHIPMLQIRSGLRHLEKVSFDIHVVEDAVILFLQHLLGFIALECCCLVSSMTTGAWASVSRSSQFNPQMHRRKSYIK